MKKILMIVVFVLFSLSLIGCGVDGRTQKLWNDYIKLANSVSKENNVEKKDEIIAKIAKLFCIENSRQYSDFINKNNADENGVTTYDIYTNFKTLSFERSIKYKNLLQMKARVQCLVDGEVQIFDEYIHFFIEVNQNYWRYTNAATFEFNMIGNWPNAGYHTRVVYQSPDGSFHYKYEFSDRFNFILNPSKDIVSFVEPIGNPKNVVIPESIEIKNLVGAVDENGDFIVMPVTKIADYAFFRSAQIVSININTSKLETIVIPNTITSIGNYAFAACTKLRTIDIPSSVREIGERVFFNCKSLTSITLNSENSHIPSDYSVSTAFSEKAFADGSRLAFTVPNYLFQYEVIQLKTTHKDEVRWEVSSSGSVSLASINRDTGVLTLNAGVTNGVGNLTIKATMKNDSSISASIVVPVRAVSSTTATNANTFERIKNLQELVINAYNPVTFNFRTANNNPNNISSSAKIMVPYTSIDSYRVYMSLTTTQLAPIESTKPDMEKVEMLKEMLKEIGLDKELNLNLLNQANMLFEELNFAGQLEVVNLYILIERNKE